MLVCLECQFENPDPNKFCQKCGASLTERQCPSCGAMVPLDTETCDSCGALTGTFWRAIVQPKVETTCRSQNPFEAGAPSDFLDVEHRYRLLDPLIPEAIAPLGTDVRVLDCHPLSPSRLDLFCKEQNLPTDSSAALGDHCQIPTIALDYLELEPQLYPSLPAVRDAWEESDRTIILLEDRQLFPPLATFWHQQTLASFQVLHLFHQMAELWMALQPRGYASSLLQIDNVRIDEDQLLYLQRLYADTAQDATTLKALGQFWKTLLQDQSGLTSGDSLRHLCEDMIAEIVATPEVLRSQLEAIAMELQNTPGQMDGIFLATDATAATAADPISPEPTVPEDDQPVTAPTLAAADISLSAGPTLLDLTDSDEEDPADEGEDIPTIVLPMILISLEESGQSDVGRQRDHNEDFFCIQAEILKQEAMAERKLQVKGLYILCDGMGGHASGEVASETAAQTLRDYFLQHWTDELPSEAVIREGVLAANRTLYDMNQQNDSSGSGRMGTTLVMLLIQGTQLVVTHVGDSRLYRFSRRLGLEQVTVDHEVGQREIQRGVDPAIAYARPDAYQLTQALGPRDEQFVNPDVQFIDLNEDQLLLLCSDGLTDNELLEKYCESHVEPLLDFQSNLEQGVNALIELANVHNGHDNITAIVVRARVRPNLAKLRRP